MSHYIILGNFTEHGMKKIAEAPERDAEARRQIEQAGGNLDLFYTMGDFDFVAIVEMPDDEKMLKFLIQTLSMRNVVTKTLKAWTESEFAELVSQVKESA